MQVYAEYIQRNKCIDFKKHQWRRAEIFTQRGNIKIIIFNIYFLKHQAGICAFCNRSYLSALFWYLPKNRISYLGLVKNIAPNFQIEDKFRGHPYLSNIKLYNLIFRSIIKDYTQLFKSFIEEITIPTWLYNKGGFDPRMRTYMWFAFHKKKL